MSEFDALDLTALAAEALGEARCRRYLFDRPYSQDPPVDIGGAAASSRPSPNPLPPNPLSLERGGGSERRG